MQMRSAEEAQTPAMESDPLQPAQQVPDAEETPRADAPADETEPGAIAEQDTTIIPASDDALEGSGVTVQSYRPQIPQPRGEAMFRPDDATPLMVGRSAVEPDQATTLTITQNTAACLSYLFLWISGVLIFFNERRNTYVRFHALQSILFGASATVVGVVGVVVSVLLVDLGATWHASILTSLGLVCAVLIPFTIVVIWWSLIVAAWNGHELPLPILGRYAKHYATPANQPTATPRS